MSEEFTHDVFVSYASADRAVVSELAHRLKADGLRVWLDVWEIKAGEAIPQRIQEGRKRSRVQIVAMSAHAFASDWVAARGRCGRFTSSLDSSSAGSTNARKATAGHARSARP